MHAIIGKGNLGTDLAIALKNKGQNSDFYDRDRFEWPEATPHFNLKKYQCVWYCAGKGSVEGSSSAFGLQDQIATHTFNPVSLALELPSETRLVVFSSDYAADEADMTAIGRTNPRPKSLYALTKIWMEQGITFLKRPNTTIVRVTSLYGHHFPERCLPGKLRRNYPEPCEIFLPQNLITPTPTWWAAERLVHYYTTKLFSDEGTLVHHLAPMGNCTVIQWGRKILGPQYQILSKGFDQYRPSFSKLGCSLGKPEVTWEDLWDQHCRQAQSGQGR